MERKENIYEEIKEREKENMLSVLNAMTHLEK